MLKLFLLLNFAETTFAKTQEYLESGCQEVWRVMPEVQHVMVRTRELHLWFTADERGSNQAVLSGFQLTVKDLVR